jgi:hypothetical protein
MSATAPYSRPEEVAHWLTAALGIVACTLALPVLVRVSVPDPWRLATGLVFGCIASAVVRNVPSWAGAPNPVLADTRLLVVAQDGDTQIPGLPFSIQKVETQCGPVPGNCGTVPPAMNYALGFTTQVGDPGFEVIVGQGQTLLWPTKIEGQAVTLRVRDQRSYQTACTDDYWNYAWWVVDDKLSPAP